MDPMQETEEDRIPEPIQNLELPQTETFTQPRQNPRQKLLVTVVAVIVLLGGAAAAYIILSGS